MMKYLLSLAMLLPLSVFAQPINTINNPNQPGYQIPSQQRMQTQMLNQQSQQKGMLNQQLQTQTRMQQQHLESQINNNSQRVLDSQINNNSQRMLDSQINNNSQHMLESQQGMRDNSREQMLPNTSGSMLHPSGTPQPNIPLKTMSP